MSIASLLSPIDGYDFLKVKSQDNSSANLPKINTTAKFYGHNYLTNQELLIVNLGISNNKVPVASVIFNENLVGLANFFDNLSPFSMAIHADHSESENAVIDFPFKEVLEPIMFNFPVKEGDERREYILSFDIKLMNNPSENVYASARALLDSSRNNYVAGHACGRSGRMTIPLTSSTFSVIGKVNFEYTIISPFAHPRMSIGSKQTYWKSVSTKVN